MTEITQDSFEHIKNDMAFAAYGGLSFEDAPDESEESTRTAVDLGPARSLVDYLLSHSGEVARFTVDTGELIPYTATTKTREGKDRAHPNRGRGKNELRECRLIERAAKEKDKHAKITARNVAGGKTMLTVELTKRQEMSENARKALDEYRKNKAAAANGEAAPTAEAPKPAPKPNGAAKVTSPAAKAPARS